MKYSIAFFTSRTKEKIAKELRGILDRQGWEEADSASANFIFIIGGDGSFFHFAKEYALQDKRLVGIMAGNTSFSLDFRLEDIDDISRQDWKNITFLKVSDGECDYLAMNDIYIEGKLFLESDIYVNDIFLERFRGSGLLFATKCGSTGMNKSIGGPVLMDDDLWLFNEVGTCNTSGNRSLVVPVVLSSKNSMSIKLLKNKGRHMYIDGKKVKCSGKKQLYISMIKGKAKVLNIGIDDYINKIRDIFLV